MPPRCRQPLLERKAKTVKVSSTWRDPASLLHDPYFAAKIIHVRRCIENGTPLPTGYYSKKAGIERDELLEIHGIMHLHLGKANTSELLWLVEYPDHVVLLELSDHEPFTTVPPGRVLHARHIKGIDLAEAEIEVEIVDARSKRRRIVLPPRKRSRPEVK